MKLENTFYWIRNKNNGITTVAKFFVEANVWESIGFGMILGKDFDTTLFCLGKVNPLI